jgi:serine/threonine protein kinase
MPSAHVDSDTLQAYRKSAGDEPLPGYVLIEPLGRGGFGEVWKCEAPGGLHKAIKFVAGADAGEDGGNSHQFQQEFDAFVHIKSIRHPFLLTLERVEQVGGDLVMVMELADRQMRDRFDECRAEGLPGIPRDELLGYLGEAAEALDVINTNYNLQHLDVKPANLFITMGHVKVGDYGLVCRLDGNNAGAARGLTPKYVAPEVLRGTVDARSDQYSLALVYQEMLTGTFPYTGRTPQQMMLAHVSALPDLMPLPECDRAAVSQALAKKPEDRFGSCQEFIHALLYSTPQMQQRLPSRSGVMPFHHRSIETTPGPAERTGRHVSPGSGTTPLSRRGSGDATHPSGSKTLPPLTTPRAMPPLTTPRPVPPLTAASRWASPPVLTPAPLAAPPTPMLFDDDLPLADSAPIKKVIVQPIRTVVPAGRLRGEQVPDAVASARDFAASVFAAAAAGNLVPALPGDIGRLADGTFVCQFPSTVPESFAPLKLAVVRDQWQMTMDAPEAGKLVFRKSATGGLWSALSGKKAGLELTVKLPKDGKAVGEVTVIGGLFGAPDRNFVQASHTALPKIIEDVRREMGNVADRRKSPRIGTEMRLTVHPLHSDGSLEPAVIGRCKDVSGAGVAFTLPAPIKTRYAYVEFGGVVSVAGLAILMKLIRSQAITPAGEHLYAGPFRLEL